MNELEKRVENLETLVSALITLIRLDQPGSTLPELQDDGAQVYRARMYRHTQRLSEVLGSK